MLSSVLHSPKAIAVNIEIIRNFIKMRQTLSSLNQLSKEVEEVKSFLLKDSQAKNGEIKKIWQTIDTLSEVPEVPEKMNQRERLVSNCYKKVMMKLSQEASSARKGERVEISLFFNKRSSERSHEECMSG